MLLCCLTVELSNLDCIQYFRCTYGIDGIMAFRHLRFYEGLFRRKKLIVCETAFADTIN